MSPLVNDIGCFSAFMGGLLSFFSIWQLCLFQITPFFLAFAMAFHLSGGEESGRKRGLAAIAAAVGYAAAFSTVFGILGIRSGGLSGYLRHNLSILKNVSAVYVCLLAFWFSLHNRFGDGRKIRTLALPLGALFGASLAMVYLPCITPTMSLIMNFGGSSAGLAERGQLLLMTYGLGLSVSFILTGVFVSAAAGRMADRSRRYAIAAASFVLLLLPLLLATGWMMKYKTFLVGVVL